MEITRAKVGIVEKYTGWMSMAFGITLIFGNPQNVLWRIAEHSNTRYAWVFCFMIAGIVQLVAEWTFGRRIRFMLACVAGVFWAYFASQAWVVGARGAAYMSIVVVSFMIYCAIHLHEPGWEDNGNGAYYE